MSVTVSTVGFSGMCRELTRLSNKPYPEVVKQCAAKTLSAAVKRTKGVVKKVAKDKVVREVTSKFNTFGGGGAGGKASAIAGTRFEPATGKRVSIAPGKGHVWFGQPGRWRLMNDPNAHPLPTAKERAAYDAQESARKSALAQAESLVRAGIDRSYQLVKRAFYDAAVALGIQGMMKDVTGQTKKAVPANRRLYQNGTGKDESSGNKTLLTVSITQPLLAKNDKGVKALAGAVSDRLKAFETELDTGVFEDVKTRASRYPGLFVHR